jgi:vacuolar-type H+-ATPase subunit I/STV1
MSKLSSIPMNCVSIGGFRSISKELKRELRQVRVIMFEDFKNKVRETAECFR